MGHASIARVLVDSALPQLDRLFDYSVPEHASDAARPGVRVRVPLRSAGRVADGVIVEVVEKGDFAGALSELESVVSSAQVLTPEVYQLARRAADRAAGSANDIVRLAVPKRQARVEKAWLGRVESSEPSPRQPVAPVAVAGYPEGVVEDAVARGGRLAVDAIPRVTDVPGAVSSVADSTTATSSADVPPATWVGEWAVTMAQAATHAIASDRSVILVVPDYRDQQQLQSALAALLPPDRIVRLDATQSNADRYHAFLSCLEGAAVVAIGNRSTVYAPVARLGLIAVWDDGDPLHVEPLAPYVHTRDAALLRQELCGCALLFFSHARSAEVERLVEVGWLTPVAPTPAVNPRVIATALQANDDAQSGRARIPTAAWATAREALDSGPVLVQVARPGYAPRLACAGCGETARCRACEGPLGTATVRSAPACRWCGSIAVNWSCTHCGVKTIRAVGSGSARTADELGRAFPGVRIIVSDGDHIVTQVDARPALVIATRGAEPIATGGYRAALLLDGERMLARESLRVAEDCLRWWSNAAALVAPRKPVVLVGVGGEIARALSTWRQAEFIHRELVDRRALRFPPVVRVATLTGTADEVSAAVAAANVPSTDVLGPVEAGDGTVRTIVRFDYARGADVAATLRAEIVRVAASRRRGPRGTPVRGSTLRARFDDVEPFDS